MWWLLKMLFVGPPSKVVETSIRRQLADLREDVSTWEQKQATLKGMLLTQTRRITKLEQEFNVDDEDIDGDSEFNKLLEEKRRSRG